MTKVRSEGPLREKGRFLNEFSVNDISFEGGLGRRGPKDSHQFSRKEVSRKHLVFTRGHSVYCSRTSDSPRREQKNFPGRSTNLFVNH